jgi:hypothetical protein
LPRLRQDRERIDMTMFDSARLSARNTMT